jgi:hypothetical protein
MSAQVFFGTLRMSVVLNGQILDCAKIEISTWPRRPLWALVDAAKHGFYSIVLVRMAGRIVNLRDEVEFLKSKEAWSDLRL